jgi:hypothetical protein
MPHDAGANPRNLAELGGDATLAELRKMAASLKPVP